MTYYERPINKNHTTVVAIVIGVLVMVAFIGFIAASVGNIIPGPSGAHASPVNTLQSTYSFKNVNCAFTQLNCNLSP